jgi:hypothetical protein
MRRRNRNESEDPAKILHDAMEEALASFRPNELAVLGLTSNIEGVIRDRLTYQLFRKFRSFPGVVVHREWKRMDIAVTVNNMPIFVAQLTSRYTFDAHMPKKLEECAAKLNRDMARAERATQKTGEIFLVFICVGVEPRDVNPDWIIAKHNRWIRATHLARGSATRTKACSIFSKRFFGDAHAGKVQRGSAYGFDVTVDHWISGPFPPPPKLTKKDIAAIEVADRQFARGEYYTMEEVKQHFREKYGVRFRSLRKAVKNS